MRLAMRCQVVWLAMSALPDFLGKQAQDGGFDLIDANVCEPDLGPLVAMVVGLAGGVAQNDDVCSGKVGSVSLRVGGAEKCDDGAAECGGEVGWAGIAADCKGCAAGERDELGQGGGDCLGTGGGGDAVGFFCFRAGCRVDEDVKMGASEAFYELC